MTNLTPLQSERQYLIQLLKDLKPSQWQNETLCEGWDIGDLVAHMIVRESGGLLARLGIFMPVLSRRTDRAMARVKATGSEAMIRRLERGPWWASHLSFNIVEHYVHNEDILRSKLKRSRVIGDDVERALAKLTPTVAQARLPHGQILDIHMVHGHIRKVFTVGSGASKLKLSARPSELLLLAQGRGRVAHFDLEGSTKAQAEFRAATRSGV